MSTALATRRAAVLEGLEPTPYLLSVDQYLRMVEAGVLGKYDRVELIEGRIVNKMSRHAPHDDAVSRLNRRLTRMVPDEWIVRCQQALVLKRSVLEPDLTVIRGPEELYDEKQPSAADARLTIEVSENSLRFDRNEKGPLYADARIPEYWVVNVVDGLIEVYSQPRAGKSPGYRKRRDYRAPEELPLILEARLVGQIKVADILAR